MAKAIRYIKTGVLFLLLALGMAAGGCALPTGSADADRALAEARQNYRDASLVVRGTCLQRHIDAEGRDCYDLSIRSVFAGSAQSGDMIHCISPMKEGQEYLLYLAEGEDVFHTEDMQDYVLVSGAPLEISDGQVAYNGQQIQLSALLQDMAALDAMITTPANIYYYDTLGALALAADDIFIGKVEQVPALQEMQLRSQGNGATVERTLPVSVVEVTAYGSIKGAHNYGDKVSLVYCPGLNADMVSAATLAAESFTAAQAPGLRAEGIYLFFTIDGPDGKQDYSFPINPMQGFVSLQADHLSPSRANRAMTGVQLLDDAVMLIHQALQRDAT